MIYMIWGSDARGGWDTDRSEWHHGVSSDKEAVERRVRELNEAVQIGDYATVERLDPLGYGRCEALKDISYQLVEVSELV